MNYKELLDRKFDRFKFYQEDHHYECNGEKVGISVTTLISSYANEFDSETIAERVAIKENKTIEQVLKEWQRKNDWSCKKGSICHEYAQSIWSGNKWIPYQNKDIDKIRKQADQFYQDYNLNYLLFHINIFLYLLLNSYSLQKNKKIL